MHIHKTKIASGWRRNGPCRRAVPQRPRQSRHPRPSRQPIWDREACCNDVAGGVPQTARPVQGHDPPKLTHQPYHTETENACMRRAATPSMLDRGAAPELSNNTSPTQWACKHFARKHDGRPGLARTGWIVAEQICECVGSWCRSLPEARRIMIYDMIYDMMLPPPLA